MTSATALVQRTTSRKKCTCGTGELHSTAKNLQNLASAAIGTIRAFQATLHDVIVYSEVASLHCNNIEGENTPLSYSLTASSLSAEYGIYCKHFSKVGLPQKRRVFPSSRLLEEELHAMMENVRPALEIVQALCLPHPCSVEHGERASQ